MKGWERAALVLLLGICVFVTVASALYVAQSLGR